jgi:prevent-host-death family protein
MTIVNIYEAKTQLSKLVDQAAAGTDVIIGRSGKPVARITALESSKAPIRFGVLKNRIKMAKDFDAPLPETILAAFEGR